jgi:cysteinyl-tRNA synthetase
MALQLYNTLTRRKEEFAPIDPRNVRMYVCGPTIYDYAHIGNARPLIVFDVLFRLLRENYGAEHVTYVRNITDVDDKINTRAAEQGISIRQLTEETNAIFQADAKALGCLEPTAQPRATEHIAAMIAIVERLLASCHAYPADGHVLFDVPSMPDYGKLSRRSLDEMIAGGRVEVAPYKRGPMDFVLWKPSSADEPGWESPWGRGRPGWHLECSAMSFEYLGETFDIHGGGIDLVFPHHENEIAQSCCAFGHDVMANYWVHNGFLQVEGEKMSKSLGNFVTIHQALADWPGEVLRLNMLKTHYRRPIDWTLRSLEESSDTYFELLDVAEEYLPGKPDSKFVEALLDDLNTPLAVARLHEIRTSALNGDIDSGAALKASLMLVGLALEQREAGFVVPTFSHGGSKNEIFDAFMRLFPKNYPVGVAKRILRNSTQDLEAEIGFICNRLRFAQSTLRTGDAVRLNDEIEAINEKIRGRLTARAAKNWAESDRIRDELDGMGIALKDNKDGTTSWEVKR